MICRSRVCGMSSSSILLNRLLIVFFFFFFIGFFTGLTRMMGTIWLWKKFKKISQNRIYWVRTVTTRSTHFRFVVNFCMFIYLCLNVAVCSPTLFFNVARFFFIFLFLCFFIVFLCCLLFDLFSHSWIIFFLTKSTLWNQQCFQIQS